MPFQASTIVPPMRTVDDPPNPLDQPDAAEELPPQPASTPTSSTRQAPAMSPRRRACCIEASQVENWPASAVRRTMIGIGRCGVQFCCRLRLDLLDRLFVSPTPEQIATALS